MLNYNSPISDTKKYSEIEISEIEPIFKLNLRGKNRDFTTKVGKSLSIIPPTDPNTSSGNENLNILWPHSEFFQLDLIIQLFHHKFYHLG